MNLTTRREWQYSWDMNDRMIMATNGNVTVQYDYDVFGRRIQRMIGESTTLYQYQGIDVLSEETGDDSNVFYTLTGGMLGQIISVRKAGKDYFYHYDPIGNVMMITNS